MDAVLKVAGAIFLGLIALAFFGAIVLRVTYIPGPNQPTVYYDNRASKAPYYDGCEARFVGNDGAVARYEVSPDCK